MNGSTTRPIFFEGQRLAAADLDEVVDYGRARAERHDRLAHRWGIVSGLDLELEDAPGGGKRLVVTPGVAIDGNGREILVTAKTELDPMRFLQAQGARIDPEALYPVFIVSQFKPQATTAGFIACGATSTTRVAESFEISFGRLGGEVTLDEQQPAPLSAEPTPAEGPGNWLILLGFVKWNDVDAVFAEATPTNGKGVNRRYVGVNADTVAGHAGVVQLQAFEALEPGQPVLEVSDTNGLRFGLYKGNGVIDALLTVAKNGDLKATGALSGRLTTGNVQVQSGVATDGMLLPLPPGISQAQVDDGSAQLYMMVSPHIDRRFAPDTTHEWAALVQECRVGDDRRVHCRVCWFDLDFTAAAAHGTNMRAGPGSCDFVVLATTPEAAQ
jgi:hypothetical protein